MRSDRIPARLEVPLAQGGDEALGDGAVGVGKAAAVEGPRDTAGGVGVGMVVQLDVVA